MAARSALVSICAALAAGALALTGCASNSENTGGAPTSSLSTSVSKAESAASLLPASVSSSGKLIVGVNVPYAPNEFIQNGKVAGFDVDLMDAIANTLGITAEYRQASFDKIIPSVQSGSYDVGMSSFTDTKEREKSVSFVDYFSAGVLWAAKKGTTVDPTNACGLTVSVQSNTYEQQTELPALSKKCTTAGKKAITIQPYPSQDTATTAAVLGKVDAVSADSPIISYAIKQSGGKLVQAGSLRDAAPYGWAIKKNSTLISAMSAALKQLIKDGTYLTICKHWGVQAGAIKSVQINGATS